MSHSSRLSRVAFAAAAGAALSLGAAAPANAAIDKQLVYQCKFPIIAGGNISFSLEGSDASGDAAAPDWPVLAHVTLKAPLRKGLSSLKGLSSIEGVALLDADVDVRRGGTIDTEPANLSFLLDRVAGVPTSDPTADLELVGQGSIPKPDGDGAIEQVSARKFGMSLLARDANGTPIRLAPITRDWDNNPITDSDNDPDTFDVICKLDPPTQDVKLLPVVGIPNQAPGAPGSLAGSKGDGSVTLRWPAASDADGDVDAYRVYQDGVLVQTLPATELTSTVTGLVNGRQYEFVVTAIDDMGAESAKSAVVKIAPEAPQPVLVEQSYSLAGSAQIKTLSRGTLPISGGIDAALDVETGLIEADLRLNQTSGRLTAIGFLPVTAKIGFAPSGKTTGSLREGSLETRSLVRIKVQEVKLFGAIPLAGGNSCQTKSLSEIKLKNTQEFFDYTVGGPITGTFAISDLNGCGVLNGLVSPLTAGGGNTLNLNLTPAAAPQA